MLFKNITAFRLTDDWTYSADALCRKLKRFQPIAASAAMSAGWIPPREDGDLAYASAGQLLLALRVEAKVIPASVVRKELIAKVRAIEDKQGRKPGRKEIKELKEQIVLELLPRAFPKDKDTYVWIDPKNRWFVVGGSPRDAERVIEYFKDSLEAVPMRFLATATSPIAAMTDWLTAGVAPSPFTIDRDCELAAPVDGKPTVKYVRHNLDGDGVRQHLTEGKQASRLALTYNDRVSFVLTDTLEIKRIAFLDVVLDTAFKEAEEADDDMFDADLAIQAGELSALLTDLIEALGGENQQE